MNGTNQLFEYVAVPIGYGRAMNPDLFCAPSQSIKVAQNAD
jgi:hypothetical protein